MSLFDKLMAVDENEILAKRTKKVHSDRLSELFGVDTDITIEALRYRRVKRILAEQIKSNGEMDPDKNVDAECHLIRLSVTEIPWGDKQLQEKFGASDPKDLVEKLFDYDIGKISDEIVELSGYGEGQKVEEEKLEEEVKN